MSKPEVYPATVQAVFIGALLFFILPFSVDALDSGVWKKYESNPLIGANGLDGIDYGTVFDVCVLKEADTLKMWSSWRDQKCIAFCKSTDGIHWTQLQKVLLPISNTWEDDLNRPGVVKRNGTYRMWYTGQSDGNSYIGYATSPNGITWTRIYANSAAKTAVFTPSASWETPSVMNPMVLWDSASNVYKMWYCGGQQYEPDAIGYATSPDGINWTRNPNNPIFTAAPSLPYEAGNKVGGCQVIRQKSGYLMFYISYKTIDYAQVSMAFSQNGITNWQKFSGNPIVVPTNGAWDASACYKPSAVYVGNRWQLYYNGRNGSLEQIGMAYHDGYFLGLGDTAPENSATSVARTTIVNASNASVASNALVNQYVTAFNSFDATESFIVNAIPNSAVENWIANNVPLFECSDKSTEEMYYYRWWTYRKHIKSTTSGYIITEFLPDVGWAGQDNSICAAAGHHFYEGRWISNRTYLQDYAKFWMKTNQDGALDYSSWIPAGMYASFLVDGNKSFIATILADAVSHYRSAESKWYDANPGLYHILPDRDAMEMPISGDNEQYRPTINAYAYGNATAIARMAALSGNTTISQEFSGKASAIKASVQNVLWDNVAGFFKVKYRGTTTFSAAREEVGFVPWYFNLPAAGQGYEAAWSQIKDSTGFYATYGPTSAERRNAGFRANAGAMSGEHECQWNGPSWPFATSQTLVAMGNVLRNYSQTAISKNDYLATLNCYTRSQRKNGHPWIAEDLNPLTGAWIADIQERSECYNHSTYNDLIISGIAGLVPREDSTIEINPLLPDGAWDYFSLDRVLYHGHLLTILYDKTGTHYNKGQGLVLYVDGTQVAKSATLSKITYSLGGTASAPPSRSIMAGPAGERAFNVVNGTFILPREYAGTRNTISVFDLTGRLASAGVAEGNVINLKKQFGVSKGIYIVQTRASRAQNEMVK